MAKGTANVSYVRQGSQVTADDVPNWDFLYESSTLKDPRWNPGDRVVLPDGRVFRYAKASAAVASTSLAVSFSAAVKIAFEAFAGASAVGDTKVTINQASITADELRGGYLVFNHGTSLPVFAGIIGNTASDSSNNVVVYIDRSLPVAVTTALSFEILSNPYAAVNQASTNGTRSFAGIPAAAAANGAYFWVQTWGPIWAAPQASVAATAYIREVYFRHDGSLDIRTAAGDLTAFVTDQRAGFVIDQSDAGQGPPLVMLQVSI
jgi:hypothetical protein